MNKDRKEIVLFITGLVLYVITGLTLIVGSISFMISKNRIAKLMITSDITIPTLIFGLTILLGSTAGAIGAWKPRRYKYLLKIMMYNVIMAIIFEMVMGLDIYMKTITPKKNFNQEWNSWTVKERGYIQFMGSCCGYTSYSDRVSLTGFCRTDEGATGCARFITSVAKNYYFGVYTCLFAFIGLNFVTVFTAAVLIRVRNEAEKYEQNLRKLSFNI